MFESTLYSMHRNYFKPDKQMPIPSRALEGVFYSVSRRWGVEARWLAVNAQAMSLDHKPKDQFERAAVKSLRRSQAVVRRGGRRRIPPGRGDHAAERMHQVPHEFDPQSRGGAGDPSAVR